MEDEAFRNGFDGIDQPDARARGLPFGQFRATHRIVHRGFVDNPCGDVRSGAAIAGEFTGPRVEIWLPAHMPEARRLTGQRHPMHRAMKVAAGVDRCAKRLHPGAVEAKFNQIAERAAIDQSPGNAGGVGESLRDKGEAVVRIGLPQPVARDIGQVAVPRLARGQRQHAVSCVGMQIDALS